MKVFFAFSRFSLYFRTLHNLKTHLSPDSTQVPMLILLHHYLCFVCRTITHSVSKCRAFVVLVFIFTLLLFTPQPTWSQAGTLDPTFSTSVGADNGSVRWILKLPGGDYLVAGDFTSYGGAARGGIARITSTGALVGSFAPAGVGAGTGILCMGRRSDGNIYIGGNFTTYNGTTVNGIALIDPTNGNLNAGFTANTGTGLTTEAPGPVGIREVFTMTVQSDDKVLIGGTFERFNTIARVSIARLNTDGTLDLSFTPGDGPFSAANGDGVCCDAGGIYPGVRNIKIDGGTGKIYVSGFFTGFQPGAAPFFYNRGYLMRLNSDGTMDAAFDPTPADPYDNCFFTGGNSAWPIEFDGTKILVGGNFTTFNAGATTTPRNQIARLNNDGTLDAAFNPANGVNGTEIQSLSLMANGTYLIGGTFTNYFAVGNSRNRIARVNPDGTLDATFNPGSGANQTIFFILPDGDFAVIGGLFTDYNGTTVSRIARVRNATPPTAFTSLVPPSGMVGVPYSFPFTANGSPAPTFALQAGTLPAGLTLSAAGVLSGTPSTPLLNNFTLRASNAGGDFDQAFSININQRSLTYGAGGFTEALANNGSINNGTPLAITLLNDTFTGANGDDFVAAGKLVVTNLPAGLTVVATRTSPTQVDITITGNAAAHANAQDIANLTFTFQNTAFTGGAAGFVVSSVRNDLTIDFIDPYTATYSSATFAEAVANDGSITQTQTITLNGGELWTAGVANGVPLTSPMHFSAINVPVGLTMVLTKISATQVQISFTGNATPHAAASSVNNVQITFTAAALANAAPASIGGLNGTNLTLSFGDGTATYSMTNFPEAPANNGSITQTRTITLTGDTWTAGVANGADLVDMTHYTVANVPAGLTLTLTKNSATQVTIAFTGLAAAHAAINSVMNIQITFLGTALTGGNAAIIAGLNTTNLSIAFNDPPPVAPTMFTAQTPPSTITAGQLYSYTFGANGSPAPTYMISSGALPPGITLNPATGLLSGVAGAIGTFGPIVVQAINAGGMLNSIAFSITVLPPAAPALMPVAPLRFTLGASAVLSASIGIPYLLTLIADGTPNPSYSLIAGTLPRGLSLSSAGVISGTPMELGSSQFTVEARNVAGATTIAITMVVGPPRPFVTSVSGEENATFGSTIIIRGYNLSAATGVTFGGISALSFTIDSDNQITAIVGNGASGNITVSAPLGNSSAGQTLRYVAPPQPEIAGFENDRIPSGDDDYRLVVRGRNLSPLASYLVSPLTNTNASFNTTIPAVVVEASSTQAILRVPLATRTIGLKRLTVQITNLTAISTFAVVPGAPPLLITQTVPSTVASSRAFTTFITGRNLFRRGFASITANGEPINAEVLDSVLARVEIPARMNELGSRIRVRLTNYDGQFSEIGVNIVSRIAPFINNVRAVWRNNRLFLVITGSGFFGVPQVRLQNLPMRLVRNTPAELEVEVPEDFPRPALNDEALVLIVENPDMQRYGFRLAPSLFYPPTLALTQKSIAEEQSSASHEANAEGVHSSLTTALTNGFITAPLLVFPNPATESLIVELPIDAVITRASQKSQRRVSVIDTRGVAVLTMFASVSEGQITVPLLHLPQGAYLLEVEAGKQMLRGRFVKR
jgi:uncharacterized delta-60 repeat protein